MASMRTGGGQQLVSSRRLAIPAHGGSRQIPGREDWDADALRDIVPRYVIEHAADEDAVLVIDETDLLKRSSRSAQSASS